MIGGQSQRWLVERHGALPEFEEIVVAGSDSVSRPILPLDATAATEWEISRRVHLLNAAVYVRFGSSDPMRFQSEDREHCDDQGQREAPSLSQIFRLACERELVGKAVCSFRTGGPEGLFDAYEALSYELIDRGVSDYVQDIGTREWLVQNGWATEEEIDRFLATVLHFRRGANAPAPIEAISPCEAETLVRQLLWKLTLYCSTGQAALECPARSIPPAAAGVSREIAP